MTAHKKAILSLPPCNPSSPYKLPVCSGSYRHQRLFTLLELIFQYDRWYVIYAFRISIIIHTQKYPTWIGQTMTRSQSYFSKIVDHNLKFHFQNLFAQSQSQPSNSIDLVQRLWKLANHCWLNWERENSSQL